MPSTQSIRTIYIGGLQSSTSTEDIEQFLQHHFTGCQKLKSVGDDSDEKFRFVLAQFDTSENASQALSSMVEKATAVLGYVPAKVNWSKNDLGVRTLPAAGQFGTLNVNGNLGTSMMPPWQVPQQQMQLR